MIIAIDGLSGVGKTSAAAKIAALIDGVHPMDTGAMFRAIGYAAITRGIDIRDETAVTGMLPDVNLEFIPRTRPGQDEQIDFYTQVIVDGEDATTSIRSAAADEASSVTSTYPAVRAKVLELEHELAETGDFVVDGRDIGTVVFPDAEYKFFLTASIPEKARRRSEQNKLRGTGSTDIAQLEQEMRERDERDSTREQAPCVPAADAVIIDTDDYDLDEVVSIMERYIRSAEE